MPLLFGSSVSVDYERPLLADSPILRTLAGSALPPGLVRDLLER
jgi:hypothetical protein